ncbi:hypothetical protein TI03_02335, partial [Achromatium sp. WMS1]
EPFGFHIKEASGGQEALNMCKQQPPDLVLLDLVMPSIDGLTVARYLKMHTPHLPVIAVSVRNFADDRAQSATAGCLAHIAKPVQLEEILMLLERYLPLTYHYQDKMQEEVVTNENNTEKTIDLAEFSQSQKDTLHDAIIIGDDSQVNDILKEIATQNADTAAIIKKWYNDYKYQQILDLLT